MTAGSLQIYRASRAVYMRYISYHENNFNAFYRIYGHIIAIKNFDNSLRMRKEPQTNRIIYE